MSCATIATLAIGVGLDTGVFTLVDGMLFRARVEQDPQTYVQINPDYSGTAAPPARGLAFTSLRDYRAYRERAQSLRGIAAWSPAPAAVGAIGRDAAAVDMVPMLVTCNYFEVFGAAPPLMGRLLRDDECRAPGSAAVVVIGEDVWRARFGADPRIIGATIALNHHPFTVVGVMRADYAGNLRSAIWVPYTMQASLSAVSVIRDERWPWLVMIGRLKPGVSAAAAQGELSLIAAEQDRLEPGRQTTIRMTNGAFIAEPMVQSVAVWIVPLIMGALSLVLLIACANVTMLLLSRAAARQHEMAVRVSLGASRARLVRMLLTESVVLAAVAMPLSAGLARLVPIVFKRMTPTLPFYPLAMNLTVFGYLAAVTMFAGVLAGLAPALESLKPSVTASLQGQDTLSGATRWRTRDVLVALQVAMSLVMLAAAALFVRAEYRLVHSDPGFETEHALLVVPRLRIPPHTPATIAAFHRTLVDRLRGLPGVRAVAHTSSLPIGDEETATPSVLVRAAGDTAEASRAVSINTVSPDFFAALGIPIVRGTVFDARDAALNPQPILVSESLARATWPDRDPVGERMDVDGRPAQVVGVARDIRSLLRGGDGVPTVYQPRAPETDASALVVRFQGDATAAAAAVRSAIAGLDPDAMAQPRTIAALREEAASRFMRLVANVVFLAFVAGMLAVIGIYAVVAFAMSRRTKEIGIRIALGATRADIMRLVMLSGTRPIAAGLAVGTVFALLGAQAVMKALANAPVPLEPRNPTTYGAAALLLAVAAIAAMLVPAYRAASADPVHALRQG